MSDSVFIGRPMGLRAGARARLGQWSVLWVRLWLQNRGRIEKPDRVTALPRGSS